MSQTKYAPAYEQNRPGTLTYPGGIFEFGPGKPTLAVNDQMGYLYERPEVLGELQAGRLDSLIQLAGDGLKVGMAIINVQLMERSLDQMELVPRTVCTLVQTLGCGIAIDARDPAVVERGLAAYQPYKAMCNSVNGEWENLKTMLPLVARYGAAVGTALVYERGVPETVGERLKVARRIVDAAEDHGIPRQDVMIDCVCLPGAVVPDSMSTTLQTIKAVREELGAATLQGISNAGVMMPQPLLLDLAYLQAAVSWGLDVAMVSPYTPLVEEQLLALDFLMGYDPYGKGFLNNYRRKMQPADA